MNLLDIIMELHNQPTEKMNWTAFIYGCIAGHVQWIVMMLYFVGAVNSGDANPPAFVYTIVPTLFVFFIIFAINMVLQDKKMGLWKDYLFGERVDIILSLSAKTVLCWLIWPAPWPLYSASRFNTNPNNKSKFIQTGLWSRSRHPNYFGEIVLWIGVMTIALPVLQCWQWVALISPVFVTLLLTRVSGIPLLEKKADQKWGEQEDYEAYKKTTPVLIRRLR